DSELVVIDTDAGPDDVYAIILSDFATKVSKKKLNVLAITTVSGNTHVDNVIQNVGLTLTILNSSV
ncbi:uridine nucleosidase 1-like isoform X2, partial [Leptotrombidium deliense]